MKRRNAECGKIRRSAKRNKITEGIYGSTFLYFKFLVVWALVLLADFILEFRFEYLWPFWLLLHSVYDSFKYQGLVFSVFFVFIAFTSDMICLLFIPVHWLFFAASTYVWVQYVWHTERGICLPTISLWLLFVYIEASVRLKEVKHLPFHLDLCRPFAAHCIGYPVVTLGFGFKSFISYRLRLKKQKEVAKENDFYLHLVLDALPPECSALSAATENNKAASNKLCEEVVVSNGHAKKAVVEYTDLCEVRNNKDTTNTTDRHEYQYMENNHIKKNNNNYDDSDESIGEQPDKVINNGTVTLKSIMKNGGGNSSSSSNNKWNHTNGVSSGGRSRSKMNNMSKDDFTQRLENDIRRLKNDLQTSRQGEQELRSQVHALGMSERSLKNELSQLNIDNENLQNKIQSLTSLRQQEKQNTAQLEKKLQEEKKLRSLVENHLALEKKAKKAEEAAKAVALAATRECSDICKVKKREMENEIKTIRRELKVREDQVHQLERETQSIRQYKESLGDTEVLMSALAVMQEKNTHLENSLSAETRLKLDLFSALGEAKRQLEITQALLCQRDKEVEELQSKIAEVMAVMPVTSTSYSNLLYPKYISEEKLKSTLDPNASVYTPKTDL